MEPFCGSGQLAGAGAIEGHGDQGRPECGQSEPETHGSNGGQAMDDGRIRFVDVEQEATAHGNAAAQGPTVQPTTRRGFTAEGAAAAVEGRCLGIRFYPSRRFFRLSVVLPDEKELRGYVFANTFLRSVRGTVWGSELGGALCLLVLLLRLGRTLMPDVLCLPFDAPADSLRWGVLRVLGNMAASDADDTEEVADLARLLSSGQRDSLLPEELALLRAVLDRHLHCPGGQRLARLPGAAPMVF